MNAKRLRTNGKTCLQCGAPLPPGRRKYCSDACAWKYNYGSEPVSTASTAKKPLSKGHDLASVLKAAREHGLSYGKYIEMLKKNRASTQLLCVSTELEHG